MVSAHSSGDQSPDGSKPATAVDAERNSSSEPNLTVTYEQSFQWSGPLPPASELRSYEELVDGGAERIFKQFELEAGHRRALEKDTVEGTFQHERRAQTIAGAFAFGALAVGVYAITAGAFGVAAIVLGTTLVGVIGAFLYREARLKP